MNQDNSNKTHTTRKSLSGESRGRALLSVTVLLCLVLAGVVLAGGVPRAQRRAELATEAARSNGKEEAVDVAIVTPKHVGASSLLLPGSIQAIEETQIYARTSGYIEKRFVDIGSKVHAGQLLAVIQSPEIDQQLLQAQAETLRSRALTGQAEAETGRLRATANQSISELARLSANIEEARAAGARAKANLDEMMASIADAKAQLKLSKQNLEGKSADLDQAEANLQLATRSEERWQQLVREGAVSQQAADERHAAYQAASAAERSSKSAVHSAEADVESAEQKIHVSESKADAARADLEANKREVEAAKAALKSGEANSQAAVESVTAGRQNLAAAKAETVSEVANAQRIAVNKSFEQVTAPFTGVITTRNVDDGSLINAGNPGESSKASAQSGLFGLARCDVLRIRVSVPQSVFLAVHTGLSATVLVHEIPNARFVGKVTRIAGAMDAASRTVPVEIQLDNKNGKLIPGMYAQVEFNLPGAESIQLPSSALLTGPDGTKAAIVTGDRVHYIPVTLGRDYGSTVEIISGLKGDEQVVAAPTIDLHEGALVKVGGK